MSSEFLVALAAIEIDADNNTLMLDEAGVVQAATIASGTYYLRGDGSASDILLAVGTALGAAFAAGNTYTLSLLSGTPSLDIAPSAVSAVVHLEHTGAINYRVRWNHASTTFSPALLGFSVEKGAANLVAEDSTLSPTSLWVPNDRHRDLLPDLSAVRAEVEMADGGIDAIQRSAAQHRRRAIFELLDGRRVWAHRNSADPASSWARFWALVVDGRPCELHELDLQSSTSTKLGAMSTATRAQADGITAWKLTGASAEGVNATRAQTGMDHWDLEVEWVGVPA